MKKLNIVFSFALILLLSGVSALYAASSPSLGSAGSYAVLAGSTVTNTGSSILQGDLGLSPGTSVTGFPPGIVTGSQHVADANAAQAQNDLTLAYVSAAGKTPVTTIPTELGGSTIDPGVYTSASGTFGLTGTLTLNAHGDPNAVFVFKTNSTLITAGGSSVVLAEGAQACNIFWQVGSSATIGANSNLKGSVLALTSITLTTGAKVDGRVLARNGAVTLDSNQINVPGCNVAPIVTPVVTATTTATSTIQVAATTTVPVIATTTAPVIATSTAATTTVFITPTVVLPVVSPRLPNTGAEPWTEHTGILFLSLSMTLLGFTLLHFKKA